MDVLVAIDALDELLTMPPGWSRWHVKRLDPAHLDAAIERLRAEVCAALSEPGRGEALARVEGLADLARRAKKPPFVGGVLTNRPRAYVLVDELRQVVPRAIIAQREAGPAPLTARMG